MNPMSRQLKFSLLFLLCLYGVYAALMVWDSSFVIAGKRWFCLLDDPMISMRYARNLASGLGLVWNAGERVEGITNPGWTAIMALVHLVESDRSRTSLYIQVLALLCNVVTISIVFAVAWKISGGKILSTVVASFLVAFYYPVNYWSLLGMETSLLTAMVTGAVAIGIRCLEREQFPWSVYLLLGAATIVRIDVAVPLVIVSGYLMWRQSPNLRWRHLACLAATLLVFVGGQTLARLIYYGYPFPNTYYLKMTGFPIVYRMVRGALVTVESLACIYWPVAAVTAAGFVFLIIKHRGLPRRLSAPAIPNARNYFLPAMLVVGQVAYSIYVGGDAWEYGIYCNRFLIIVFPMMALLWAAGLNCWIGAVTEKLKGLKQLAVVATLTVCSVLSVNWRSCHPVLRNQIYLMDTSPEDQVNNQNAATFSVLLSVIPSTAKVSSDWAGSMFYFLDRYAVDPLGKCDVFIAHQEVARSHWITPRWENAFYPGHMKWDMEYTLKKYHPDYMIFGFAPLLVHSRKIIEQNYESFRVPGISTLIWIRKDLPPDLLSR